MKNPSKIRYFGLFLIILSGLGIIFSFSGIITIWIIKPIVNNELLELQDSINDTLGTTLDGLAIIDTAINNSITNLDIVENSLRDLSITIDSVSYSLDSSASLVGDDLRLTINETQVALISASSSAEFIDKSLNFLAGIPLIGVDYEPDVPLHTSLEQVAVSLEDVPDSLETIEQSLKKTVVGLEALELDLLALVENISNIEEDLDKSKIVIEDYQIILNKLSQKGNQFRQQLSTYLTIGTLIFSAILFWLGIAQINILMQGIDFWQGEQSVVNLADIQRN